MKLKFWHTTLNLKHAWTIASRQATALAERRKDHVIIVELSDPKSGTWGLGEATPSARYGENIDSAWKFIQDVDPTKLDFNDFESSMAYLDGIRHRNKSAMMALNIALLDGVARKAEKPIYDFLGLGFHEDKHVTSFSIGIDSPETIRQKVSEALSFPVLKLKVGSQHDRENLEALRSVAPDVTVRIDGNEAWKDRDEALRNIEWFARDPHIELVEQPMPASSRQADLVWLKERSPLPLMADESCIGKADISLCAECYHAVNVKLVKSGGITGAYETLTAAKKAGLKTMIGCMIETSILITAAAHLSELTDYLDIDGNLLITNDPYKGVTAENGKISFKSAPGRYGLRVRAK